MSPTTLNELFFGAMTRLEGRPVILRDKRDGAWVAVSPASLLERVHHLHCGLRELGLVAGDHMAILSENRPEWAIADFACLTARLADVPVYPTLPAHQVDYLLRNSGAKGAFISNAEQLAKVLECRTSSPALQHLIVFDEIDCPDGVISLRALEARGAAAVAKYPAWKEEALEVHPDDLATLIYTSGTTGDPKGVMLTHGNITSNVVASLQCLSLSMDDECLSFLPLSHIFERMVGHYTMLQAGTTINYASSMDALLAEVGEIRPTVMPSVPRLYEKIYAKTVESAQAGGGLKRSIFEWAKATGLRRLDFTLTHREVPLALELGYRVADALVFSTLRAKLGGRLGFFVSGGAPLNPDICRFFIAAGLPILEGYGLTETSPVMTVNTFEHLKPGTVGRPIPGVEIMIAPDGEILTRGPNVMQGYYNNPAATAEAIDAAGWFHTGDVGVIDAEGFLKITDRKKDLIVTAGGKNIAPQPIEALLKTSKYFLNAVMLGDKRKFPIMLLVPNRAAVVRWLALKGRAMGPDEAIAEIPEAVEKLEREARRSLRDLAHYEMPKKFLILDHDFSIEGGELTPKMSVRRKVVEEQYRDQIEALFTAE
ncbi:MAG: long-chain fatty acid--CoA ligase [Gemmatimonadota bacterium]